MIDRNVRRGTGHGFAPSLFRGLLMEARATFMVMTQDRARPFSPEPASAIIKEAVR